MIIGRKNRRRVTAQRVFRLRRRKETDPVFVLNISTGYQGVKKVGELTDIKKVTISRKTYRKLKSKPGHLSVKEIQSVLKDSDGIYYDDENETWFYTQSQGKTNKVVIKIEKGSGNHRIATAHVMSTQNFLRDVNRLNLNLVWQR